MRQSANYQHQSSAENPMFIYQLDMNKISGLLLAALCLSLAAADTYASETTPITFSTPVPAPQGRTTPTIFDVWPAVDSYLKTEYWYYLRGSNPLYQASIDAVSEYVFFTIYRNTVGTFLVSTTWAKDTQNTQINAFVRLGNGYDPARGQIYDPVNIDPFIVSIALKPDEYMVIVNPDGSISVTGNKERYQQINGDGSFNITADMDQKAKSVDKVVRDQYWYYLDNSTVVSTTSIPTTNQYYFVTIYINRIGTFLCISHWDLKGKVGGVNTLVRLGSGFATSKDFGPVDLSPSVLKLESVQ